MDFDKSLAIRTSKMILQALLKAKDCKSSISKDEYLSTAIELFNLLISILHLDRLDLDVININNNNTKED